MLILRESADRRAEIARRMVGASVLGVTYRQTEHGGLTGPPSGPVHEVDLDVVLELSTGVISVTWEREDLVEGLAVGCTELAELEGVASVPAGGSEVWQQIVGRAITDVYVGWQVSEVGCPESLWSMWLSFGPKLDVVIALGELDGFDRPMYHPDSLLLLFEESVARSYQPVGAATSAWGGEPILGK